MVQATSPTADGHGGAVRVERHNGLVLLRSAGDASFAPEDVADLARGLRTAGDRALTVLCDPGAAASVDLWPRLRDVLDAHRGPQAGPVRLALSGAGAARGGQSSAARTIADAWQIIVEAPVGAVLVGLGGALSAPPGPDRRGGWLGHAPGTAPVLVGTRCPASGWQAALAAVPPAAPSGCVAEEIPAGLLLRPARAAAAVPGDLFHDVPVDQGRAVVAVLPGVPADDVLAVLAALRTCCRPPRPPPTGWATPSNERRRGGRGGRGAGRAVPATRSGRSRRGAPGRFWTSAAARAGAPRTPRRRSSSRPGRRSGCWTCGAAGLRRSCCCASCPPPRRPVRAGRRPASQTRRTAPRRPPWRRRCAAAAPPTAAAGRTGAPGRSARDPDPRAGTPEEGTVRRCVPLQG
ncbi:hypothetical protein [Streptomyces sp. NPDC052036]|uniref:hypothetical protein n=1 Tax=Streptomyces sp. NPDC052036 TaxID=3155171 RepID=UPI00342BB2AA